MAKADQWETIIGLEIHVELNTKTKLFSSAPNRFGDEPNTNITEVCTGQPGALPVLNKSAVKKAVQFGCAINAKIPRFSKFDRKSYFYPDSPRNFQITQYDQPIIVGGEVIAEVDGEEKVFYIDRAHLEDDAGMLKHFPAFAGVDYNRAGVPLIEIVSKPCIHSAKEAVAYAMAIKAILQYLDVSDCNMEEGSLRFDANISVRLKGEEKLRNKVEIKNMNSFSNMEMAIESEVARQIKLYTKNPDLPPGQVVTLSTLRWDAEKRETIRMRDKEEADDYRYFPEPDLPPIVLSEKFVEEIRRSLPELPRQREKRYVSSLGLSKHTAFVLTSDKALADYFEEVLKSCGNAKSVANWLLMEFQARLKEHGKSIIEHGIAAGHVGKLVNLIDKNIITGRIAKEVADRMVLFPGKDPEEIVRENPDFQPMQDAGEIEAFVDQVIAENQQAVADFREHGGKSLAFLVGQVMKLSKGKASPAIVNELLRKKIGA